MRGCIRLMRNALHPRCPTRLVRPRPIATTALFKQRYALPGDASTHAAGDVLEEVKEGVRLAADSATVREGSMMLERAVAIGASAFGEGSAFEVYLQHLLAVAAFNAQRYSVAEKQLRDVLRHLDDTSELDRFAVRVMLVNAVRAQGRVADAAAACVHEEGDSAEQRLIMCVLRSFLRMRCEGAEPPHEPLNEAAERSAHMDGAREARYAAVVYALQGTLSLEAGDFAEAEKRAERGIAIVRKWRSQNSPSDLMLQMGDLLTVQGKALLGLERYLRAEEVLDEALECFASATAADIEDDVLGGAEAGHSGRCAEALLALARLFKDTSSLMYAEGVYRKLLALIQEGNVDTAHIHQAYDQYAWFLRSQKRATEAEEIEQEYLRLYHRSE